MISARSRSTSSRCITRLGRPREAEVRGGVTRLQPEAGLAPVFLGLEAAQRCRLRWRERPALRERRAAGPRILCCLARNTDGETTSAAAVPLRSDCPRTLARPVGMARPLPCAFQRPPVRCQTEPRRSQPLLRRSMTAAFRLPVQWSCSCAFEWPGTVRPVVEHRLPSWRLDHDTPLRTAGMSFGEASRRRCAWAAAFSLGRTSVAKSSERPSTSCVPVCIFFERFGLLGSRRQAVTSSIPTANSAVASNMAAR